MSWDVDVVITANVREVAIVRARDHAIAIKEMIARVVIKTIVIAANLLMIAHAQKMIAINQ